MMAAVAAAQHEALQGLPPGRLPAARQRDESWRTALQRILAGIDTTLLPQPAQDARLALLEAAPSELESLADHFLEGDVSAEQAGKAVFVAAALQVAWTRTAALLDTSDLDAADRGQCPVCGSPPIAGLIAPGGTKFGQRHLHCSLCATAWHYVRVRCVHCGSTDKISFRQIAGTSYLRAECCESCRGYSKVFYLDSARIIEPLADDLASLGLDVLVGEEGFFRVPNPFVLGVMSPQD
jgi:FdhE protein